MWFASEQRVHTVPPCEVVTVFEGEVVVGGAAVVGVGWVAGGDVGGGGAVAGGVVVADGWVVGEVPPDDGGRVPVVRVTAAVVVDACACGERGGSEVVELSARSTPPCESRATLAGATRLATRPTAANATVTDTATPMSQTTVNSTPRRTPRVLPTAPVKLLKARSRPPQVCDSGSGGRQLRPYPWRSMSKVLLVEDDDRVRVPLAHSLEARGHVVTQAAFGLPALQAVVDDPPDIVLLDLGLPDIDGGDLLKMLRAVSSVPVIVGTARDDEREIVRLLDAGADEYIVKPFSAEQVDARIRALLRRLSNGAPATVEVADLAIAPGARTATLAGEPLELSRKEFDLLLYLARHCGTVVTKQELLAEIWDQPYGGTEKTVDTHLSWLRGKLGESASTPRYLHTVRGVGIKLLAPTD